jgi:hypothetical protein
MNGYGPEAVSELPNIAAGLGPTRRWQDLVVLRSMWPNRVGDWACQMPLSKYTM